MKYWASNIAVIPIKRDPCLAPAGMAQESEWISSGITSWMFCAEHPRRLFLQLLFGSIFLITGSAQVHASGAVYKCMRVHVYTSGPGVDAGSVQIYRTSNIEHQTAIAKKGGHAFALCHILQSESPHSFLHSFTPSLLSSNGALLAHQTTSIKPLPAARNGVAARTPLPEAGEHSKKMISHFQICTEGYLAWPGIPVPASGLFIGPRRLVHTYTCEGAPETDHVVHPLNPPPAGDISSDSEMRFPPLAGARGGKAKNKIFSPNHPPNTSTPQNHELHQKNHTTYFFQYQYTHLYET